MFPVRQKRQLSDAVFEMAVEAPAIARKVCAGQFLILRVDDTGERIPLTFSDWSAEEGWVRFIFMRVGKTTHQLSHVEIGESLADVVGPLGKPTEVDGLGRVAVVGGGNSAAEESLFLTRFVDRVTLLVRGDSLSASQVIQEKVLQHPAIEVRFDTVVEAFEGAESKLHTVRTRNTRTGETEALKLPGVFVFIGLDPNTGFLSDSGVRLDRWGFIVTGHALVHDGDRPAGFERIEPAILETSVPGIFAAGDVRAESTKQVASAAGEGAAAALMIRDHLKRV